MNNNLRRFIGYLIYAIAFGYLLKKANAYHLYLKYSVSTAFDQTYYLLFMSVSSIIVGFMLALPQFITTFKQKGSWAVDWVKLLPVGIPAFLVAIAPIIPLAGFAQNCKLVLFILLYNYDLVTVAGIIFGFTLVASLCKQELE